MNQGPRFEIAHPRAPKIVEDNNETRKVSRSSRAAQRALVDATSLASEVTVELMPTAHDTSIKPLQGSAYTLRRLQEERCDVLTPTGYTPSKPQDAVLPLKTHPNLALSMEPPSVPPASSATPMIFAGSRGFSRSEAGLPWSSASQSLGAASTRSAAPASVQWNGFRSEYESHFKPPKGGLERVLNHERLVLEGQTRGFSIPELQQTSPRMLFGGRSSSAFQHSPRGSLLELGGGESYRDNSTRNNIIWQSQPLPAAVFSPRF